jgi:Protein of Unknown function (DUF2784)
MSAATNIYRLLADLVVLAHLGFVVLAVLGGLLALRWRRFVWIHLSAVIWAATVEFFGWVCPLTPLENRLRARAGEAAYSSDFIARYLLPVLYPEGLTRELQIALGIFVIVVNLAIYGWVFRSGTRTSID